MKLDKTNVCVFIEDEAHIQQAREVLERYGYFLSEDGTSELTNDSNDYMYYNELYKDFCLGAKLGMKVITLSELEEILKEELEKM